MKASASTSLWYAADIIAILALCVLGIVGMVTGKGFTPGEAATGILAVLAGRLTPRGPAPPTVGPAPPSPRRRVRRLAPSPGAVASVVGVLGALWRRVAPPPEDHPHPPTLHPA